MTGFWAWFHDGWEIVGALASAFAAGVALWLASRERADRQAAEKDRDEAREAQRRAEMAEARREREAQARQVVVMVERYHEGSQPSSLLITVGNYSGIPVTDLNVRIRVGDSSHSVGFNFALKAPVTEWPMRVEAPIATMRPYNSQIYVEFTDATGTRWNRFADGGLEELALKDEHSVIRR
ncbi:hypothetical protein ACFWH7_04475 [Cellulosimicrobium cellulans]|uniref:hypothetical protein n=1 Tax=Cellulosimicrobium cellulans TaxID=1710 RepID=UPI0036512854